MSKLKIAILLLIALIIGVVGAVVYAVLTETWTYGGTATGQTLGVTNYLDNVMWANNTDNDWGNVVSSTVYTKTLDIKNTGELNCTVAYTVTGLPAGWTITWSYAGGLVTPGNWANGTLTLTTGTVTATTYSWDETVTATKS